MTLTMDSILSLPKIGYGNFRDVYRLGGVVYKVENVDGMDFNSNRNEYNNYLTLLTRKLPTGIVLPMMDLIVVEGLNVVLSEYIDGKLVGECFCLPGEPHYGCIPPGMERDLNALGIDVAYGNIILKDSTYYLIDLDADLV